jgi:hypothetical protein
VKEIFLSCELVALIDDENFEEFSRFKWHINAQGYAVRNAPNPRKPGRLTPVRMHREIMGLEIGDPRLIDHIDGNRLNNQRINLRLCNKAQNGQNRGRNKNNTSGYKGVTWDGFAGRWLAQIFIQGKKKNLGRFDFPEEAHAAYCRAALIHHGEFVNFGEAA